MLHNLFATCLTTPVRDKLQEKLHRVTRASGQPSTVNIGHVEVRAENTYSGKMVHISINMCDNQNP